MPLVAACPSCEKRFRANDSLAGKRVKCPRCDGVFRVPGGQRQAAVESSASETGEQSYAAFFDEAMEEERTKAQQRAEAERAAAAEAAREREEIQALREKYGDEVCPKCGSFISRFNYVCPCGYADTAQIARHEATRRKAIARAHERESVLNILGVFFKILRKIVGLGT